MELVKADDPHRIIRLYLPRDPPCMTATIQRRNTHQELYIKGLYGGIFVRFNGFRVRTPQADTGKPAQKCKTATFRSLCNKMHALDTRFYL